jgi:aminoglycoside 6'-N-acetyltransferase I
MHPTRIRLAQPSDREPISHLRESLWPEASAADHAQELAALITTKQNGTTAYAIFVAEAADGTLVGFLEAGLRSHADGCDPKHPVGFLEGWFVSESHRRQGVGARLLTAAEDWARNLGCAEMASDTWIDHALSQRVHEALGFEVVDRCVHYRKAI